MPGHTPHRAGGPTFQLVQGGTQEALSGPGGCHTRSGADSSPHPAAWTVLSACVQLLRGHEMHPGNEQCGDSLCCP